MARRIGGPGGGSDPGAGKAGAVVAVAWVGFRNRRDAGEFKKLIDVHSTGDITPLGAPPLDLADIRFTGLHYQSRPDGSTVVIAETESASGHVSGETLDAVADMASWLPRQAATARTDLNADAHATSSSSIALSSSCCCSPSSSSPRPSAT